MRHWINFCIRHLWLLFLVTTGLVSCDNQPLSIHKNPNIVYILADDLGYGDVSCLNPDSKIHTPNIDKLAIQGMTFTDAHSGSSVCSPTRYGILTGRYAWRSELRSSVLWPWDKALIEKDRLTVGDFLKQSGYTTACIGKWHLGWNWPTTDSTRLNSQIPIGIQDVKIRSGFGKKVDFSVPIANGPVTRGFDYYFGDDVPNFPPYCFIENDHTVGIPEVEKPKNMFGSPGPMKEGWQLDQVMPAITRKAVEYIGAKHGEGLFNKKSDHPFFLYFSLTAPHTPIAPADSFRGTSLAGAYGDYVQQVDWTVGQIIRALKRNGLTENTLLIFTSDNGSPARDGTNMSGPVNSVKKFGHNPHFLSRGTKADIWEGGHHVPFIVRWPNKIDPGTSSDEIICLTDLMATCAAIIGVDLPDNAGEDSYNLLPAFVGKGNDIPVREATVHHSVRGMFAIRQGEWKLIMGKGSGGWSGGGEDNSAPGQLYNLREDTGETNNLYEQRPDVVLQLRSLLEKYKTEGRSAPGHLSNK